MMNKLLFLALSVLLCACGHAHYPHPFSEVIEHYSQNPADSLKLKAAVFLADNVGLHYGIDNTMTDAGGNPVTDFYGTRYAHDTAAFAAFDSLKFRYVRGEAVPDTETLTPEYLIENIELAFEAWAKPWARHIDFGQFCELILPYRVLSEPISPWRRYLKEKYSWVEDSVKDKTSAYEMMEYLKKAATREVRLSNNPLPYKGFLSPVEMENIGYGSCIEDAQYFTMVLRAMGVPCAYTSARVMRLPIEHTGNVIYARDTAYYTGMYEERVTPVIPGSYEGADLSRVSRKTFAISDPDPLPLIAAGDFPAGSIDLFSTDISNMCYIDTLRYQLPDSVRNEKYIYLCMFDRWNWLPIRYARIQPGGMAVIPNTILKRMYVLATYKSGKATPVTFPFVFYGGNDFEYRMATEERHPQIQLSYDYHNEKKTTKRIQTNYLNADNRWTPIEGDAELYAADPKTGALGPSEDVETPGLDRRYVLTLKNIPRYTVFYDDSLMLLRLWGISREETCDPY